MPEHVRESTTPTDDHVERLIQLAQEIRRVDGNHSLGAAALAGRMAPLCGAVASPPGKFPQDAGSRAGVWAGRTHRRNPQSGYGVASMPPVPQRGSSKVVARKRQGAAQSLGSSLAR